MNSPLRSQLRFSLFLQTGACAMFLAAFVFGGLTGGFDVLVWMFGLLGVASGAVAIFIWRKLKTLPP